MWCEFFYSAQNTWHRAGSLGGSSLHSSTHCSCAAAWLFLQSTLSCKAVSACRSCCCRRVQGK